MNERATIGLDLSYTATGISVLLDGVMNDSLSTVIKTKPDPAKPSYDAVLRAREIANGIHTVLRQARSAIGMNWPSIFIEDYAYASFANREKMGELGGIVKSTLLDLDYDYEQLSIKAVRKFVCGSGAARKDVVMFSLLKRYNLEVTQNDLADATAVALLGDHLVLARARALDLTKLYADARAVLTTLTSVSGTT